MSDTVETTVWRAFSFLLLVFALLRLAEANAWEVHEELVPEQARLLKNPAFDILVVTVLAVEDQGATNAAPPKVRLRIDEVIRGEVRDATLMVRWQAPVAHEDVAEGGGVAEAWKARPLKGPEIGAKLIVFAIDHSEVAGVQAAYVYRFSPHNRQMVREHAVMERSARIQIALFFVLLALAVLSVWLFVRSSSERLSKRAQQGLRGAVPALALLTLGVYLFYESGISAYSNIRVDLLLVWPAVGAALIVGLRSLFQLKKITGADDVARLAGSWLLRMIAFLLLAAFIIAIYSATR